MVYDAVLPSLLAADPSAGSDAGIRRARGHVVPVCREEVAPGGSLSER